ITYHPNTSQTPSTVHSPQSMVSSTFVCLSAFLFAFLPSTTEGRVRVPFLLSSNKKYTPLVFFKVPKGSIPECDEMEKVVSQVERELGIRVERLDVARDPSAQATLALLTQQYGPPYLYNRESLQTVHVRRDDMSETQKKEDDEDKNASMGGGPFIDKARVRAWAKGRYLPPPGVKFGMPAASGKAPVVVDKVDNAMDQDELTEAMKDASLTPEQLEGKEAMKERTAQRAAQ
ncbi:MAG: hypothetical protein SGILL_004713, partial [Bacillariaceae sp.]